MLNLPLLLLGLLLSRSIEVSCQDLWFGRLSRFMEESLMFGLPLALVMLGVPLWYCVGECRQGRVAEIRIFRWWLMCAMLAMIPTLTGLLFGVAGFVLSNIPASRASQISTGCRILSTSVDLRSAKMCTPQLQLLYDAPQPILPHSKFRCYFDYYWASVFKVEFEPQILGLPVQAVAEVPREALPAFCRPGFGAAWTLKEMYQVWMNQWDISM